jgi:hypothetical protein
LAESDTSEESVEVLNYKKSKPIDQTLVDLSSSFETDPFSRKVQKIDPKNKRATFPSETRS